MHSCPETGIDPNSSRFHEINFGAKVETMGRVSSQCITRNNKARVSQEETVLRILLVGTLSKDDVDENESTKKKQ